LFNTLQCGQCSANCRAVPDARILLQRWALYRNVLREQPFVCRNYLSTKSQREFNESGGWLQTAKQFDNDIRLFPDEVIEI
jgi:hypothetical protein